MGIQQGCCLVKALPLAGGKKDHFCPTTKGKLFFFILIIAILDVPYSGPHVDDFFTMLYLLAFFLFSLALFSIHCITLN